MPNNPSAARDVVDSFRKDRDVVALEEKGLVYELMVRNQKGSAPWITLEHIWVHEEFRGNGHGSQALKKLLQYADEKKVTVDLDVGPDDAGIDLMAWYTRHGFEWKETFMERLPKPIVPQLGFDAWSHGRRIVGIDDCKGFASGEGLVVEALHGTTSDFTVFEKTRTNVECAHGGAFYFSNNAEDVAENYAGRGPDLGSKIQRQIELYEDNDGEDLDEDDVRALVESRYIAHAGFVMPVYLRFDNPAVLGGASETVLTFDEPYDEVKEEHGEASGTLLDFIEKLRDEAKDSRWNGFEVERTVNDLMEASNNEDMTLHKAIKAVKASDGMLGACDMESQHGDSCSAEIVRRALQAMGFDGIVDTTVNQAFGSARRDRIDPMKGMDNETVHFVVFEPNQIKSRLGNVGAYNPNNLDITDRDALQVNASKAKDFLQNVLAPTKAARAHA